MQTDNTNMLDSNFQQANLEPNLIIKIEGLALSHFDGDKWNVFFPKVDKHNFKLTVEKKDGLETTETSIFIFPKEFEVEGTEITLNPYSIGRTIQYNPQVEDILDISRLHNEKVHLVSDKTKYAGFLTLDSAELVSEFSQTPTVFDIWEITPPLDSTQKTLRQGNKTIASSFSSGFKVDAADTSVINVENNFGFDLTLGYANGESYVVTFFNDCEGMNCDLASDFKHYYDIIDETKFTNKRRFELVLKTGGGGRGHNGSCSGKTASNIENPFKTKP
jgi:hypothetical protein